MKYNDTQYYYQGYSSHQTGLPYESSPHPMGDPAWIEWCRGWRDAENDSCKRLTPSETDNANQQFESLAAKPVQQWNGFGVPPVGQKCKRSAFGADWAECEVLYVGPEVIVLSVEGSEKAYKTGSVKFHPLLTEAERKRQESVRAICVAGGGNDDDNLGKKIDDGPVFGFSWFDIYDAIAAGKIPHIKLEETDE